MNVPLLVPGSLELIAAAVHGVGGEVLVVRRLSPTVLALQPLRRPVMTKAMIHVCWHSATIAFLTVGCALVLAGSVLHGDTAQGVALFAASASTGFAALAVWLGAAYMRSPRAFLRHLGPVALTAVAALAWWGIA